MDACRQIARLRDDWVRQCEGHLSMVMRTMPRALPKEEQDEFVMTQFLFADIQTSCEPSLPSDLANMHRVVLQGRYFLQIVDISNIAAGHEQRQEDSPNRMLKLCLTDGASLAYAIEHKPIRQLSAKTPRGTKIIVENVAVRHGLLMLTSVVVLGASGNESLEAATSSTTSTTLPSNVQQVPPPLPPPPALPPAASTRPQPVIAPEVQWDADLSDEERATDPSVRHLFYGSPSAASSSSTRPRVATTGRSAAPSAHTKPTPADPFKPFTYLSTVHVPRAARVVVKGFVKSVVSFEFQTGVYQLKVFVEDATRSIVVGVDPQFVEHLMGVSCATFVQAMQSDIQRGMQWVATMQHKLSVLEGLLTIDFTTSTASSTGQPTLVTCEDSTIATTRALLTRLQSTA